MKFIWQMSDIIGGTQFSKRGMNETLIICRYYDKELGDVHSATSLTDGVTWQYVSRSKLAQVLTENCYIPIEILKVLPKDM